MMTLETRARQAADSLNENVADFTPHAGFGAVMVRRRRSRLATGTLASGLAVFVLLVGAWLRGPSPEPDVAVTTTDTPVSTTLAADEIAPVIPEAPGPDQRVIEGEATPPPPPDATPDPTGVEPDAEQPADEPPVVGEPPPEDPVEREDTTPPDLAITAPKNGAILHKKRVVFEGTTEPGARVFAGRYEASVSGSGSWSIQLVLQEGANAARFTARDAAGNETTRRITVHYEPERDDPPPPQWEFSAHATFGSCSEIPPYDVYYGTGEPGTTITITSEYGGSTVAVNGEGNWEKKVVFAEAPYGKGFVVTIRDKHGTKKKFDFIAYEPG